MPNGVAVTRLTLDQKTLGSNPSSAAQVSKLSARLPTVSKAIRSVGFCTWTGFREGAPCQDEGQAKPTDGTSVKSIMQTGLQTGNTDNK